MRRKKLHRIKKAVSLGDNRLWLRFDDGREVSVDFTETFEKGGVFVPLKDPKTFARVRLENDG